MEEAVRRCLSLGGRKRGREEGRAGTVDLALPPLNPYYYHVNALPRPERKMNVAAGKEKRRGRQTTEEAEKEEEGGEGESGLGGRHRQSETAKWTCREASRAGLLNHNVHLTVFLDELIAIYDMLGSDIAGGRYRRAQYHRFVQILRGLPFAINKDNLRSLKKKRGIGSSMLKDIGEILEYGRLSRLEALKARVRSHPGILNENQRVGLRYYEEFQERIPRSEVRKIEERVREERVQARGFLGRLILHLEKEGFLTDHLTDATDDKSDSYFGVCRLGDGYLHRRLDLKVYSRQQYPFAVLYFTGSDHFNRSMRCWAIKHKGWSLTDKSMGPAVWERGKKVADIGPRIVCTEEREIFHRLGLAYKRPWERNTHDAVSLEALKKEYDEAGDSDREETGDRGNKKEAWALSPSEME
ncbi:dna polymerase lambda [Nannochloropsis gaditana]|uniref:Dna polymerase lambda n=1 Tax=Nannochloropsis gaditana TaxID=72520 RepID=W7TK70_9STRA|nr:dna polymerase lambda [Nannochloropsis gaditana]